MIEKTQGKQALLTLAFGPLGLFYSSVTTAIVLSLLFLPLIPAFGFGVVLGWPISFIVGIISVKEHNKKAKPYLELQKRKERL